jgi:hypothetical protein
MTEERRTDQVEGAYALAILYTLGYLAMMGALMVVTIPTENREILLTLAGIMSAAQLGIIKYYYDGSKGAEKLQAANIARSVKSEATIQEIAKTAPTITAPAPTPPAAPDAQPGATIVTGAAP